MNILFVAPRFPDPPLQGDRLRARQFLRVLRRHHSITLVTPDAPAGVSAATLAEVCDRWVATPEPRWRSLGRAAFQSAGSLPLQTALFCSPALVDKVRDLARHQPFDLLYLHTARVAAVIDAVPALPKVIDFIDALSLNMYRRARRQLGPAQWAFDLEFRRMANYERYIAGICATQFVSAAVDRAIIGGDAHVVANGVDLAEFPYHEDSRADDLIVFSGRMGYFPNADAAVHFARHILPRIRRAAPGARFQIVGADPPPHVVALGRLPGVEVTGQVPRIHDYLQRATVAVAPLRGGSGSPIKVFEAMASGAPVVATPHLLDTNDLSDGTHLLLAHDDNAMAEQVTRLLRDAALRRRLARAARALVEQRYTWERSAEAINGYLIAVVEQGQVIP